MEIAHLLYLANTTCKTISDSLGNCKIINCIVFSIVLNYIITLLNFGQVLCMHEINKSS